MQKLLFVALIGWLAVAIVSTNPVGGSSKSAGESSRSADGDSMTVGEITKSSGETSKPTDVTAKPSGESSMSAEEISKSIDEIKKLVDRITKSAGGNSELNESQPKADFDALNAQLGAKIPWSDGLETNLYHISANIGQLESGAKEAAQILLELSGGGCSDGMMAALLELEKSGLLMNGEKKIEKLLSDGWRRAFRTCKSYLELKYEQSRASKMRSFFEEFTNLVSGNGLIRNGDRTDQHINLSLRQLARRQLAPSLMFQLTGDMFGFNSAFDELLVEPCKQIKSNDELFNKMAALTKADRLAYEAHHFKDYWVDFRALLTSMNWTRDLCTRLINMDQQERTRVYNTSA